MDQQITTIISREAERQNITNKGTIDLRIVFIGSGKRGAKCLEKLFEAKKKREPDIRYF